MGGGGHAHPAVSAPLQGIEADGVQRLYPRHSRRRVLVKTIRKTRGSPFRLRPVENVRTFGALFYRCLLLITEAKLLVVYEPNPCSS